MPPPASRGIRIVRAAAPVRICDNGGWTDTWFAGHGCVFNLAVSPCVDVDVQVCAGRPAGLTIHAENFGPPYVRDPQRAGWDRYPLIEAAIEAAIQPPGLFADASCEITVHADVPPGASVGSSAATIVAILGALRVLNGASLAPAEIAAAAHQVETGRLGRQSGIQDQLAAAYGGASFIEMATYPEARVTPLPLPDDLRWELDARLSLVYLGRSHESSAIHERVIRGLESEGPEAPPLQALRQAARAARDAFVARDLAALGRAFQANTDAQAALHADLVGLDAWRIIDVARAHGALGWKVNGAGGEGGSIAILGGASGPATRAMRRAIAAEDPSFRLLPVRVSAAGLRVWETT